MEHLGLHCLDGKDRGCSKQDRGGSVAQLDHHTGKLRGKQSDFFWGGRLSQSQANY